MVGWVLYLSHASLIIIESGLTKWHTGQETKWHKGQEGDSDSGQIYQNYVTAACSDVETAVTAYLKKVTVLILVKAVNVVCNCRQYKGKQQELLTWHVGLKT